MTQSIIYTKFGNTSLSLLDNKMKKSAQRRHKHCTLAVVRQSQKFSPAADPPPGGAGRTKFNHLETVTTFTYKPSLVRIDARNFELSWYTNPQTQPQTHKQTGPITIHRTAASAQCGEQTAPVQCSFTPLHV